MIGILRRASGCAALFWLLVRAVDAQSPVADDFNPGIDGGKAYGVAAIVVQPDGKVVVGGTLTSLGGQPRASLGRLHPDGRVDDGFAPGVEGGGVASMALQPDGRILVGGSFGTLGGQSRGSLGRLNRDGSVDLTFDPGLGGSVSAIAVQADGRILVGGYFFTLGGQSRSCLGRLNADGTVDLSFNAGADTAVSTLAVQADGRILVGGTFATLGGQSRSRLGRLNGDGSVDPTFNPGADGSVSSLAVQADGRILVGGDFSSLGGHSRSRLGRLNEDGSVDPTFDPGVDGSVSTLAVQADGRILVGGYFTTLGGQSRSSLGRLNGDGSVDPTFDPMAGGFEFGPGGDVFGFFPGAGGSVSTLAVQADGRILVGGYFGTLGGQSRSSLGRLNSTGPAIDVLGHDGTRIRWERSGTGPEVIETVFEHTTDGSPWTALGRGERVAGGWELGGVTVPAGGTLRGRGSVGDSGRSGWWTEAYLGAPVWITTPPSRTNDAGTTAIFGALAGGSAPLSYQWRKDGEVLVDGGNVSGATTPTLTVSGVLAADAGAYTVVVSNAEGSLTSGEAVLAVLDPAIAVQPPSQNAEVGQSVTMSVTAWGTEPLTYTWRRDGTALEGASGASLTLTNVQGADAGAYTVEVSNPHGSLGSAPAFLTVNLVTADNGFVPWADGDVYSLAVQADGRILVGGSFTTLGGQSRGSLGRLNGDGSVDLTFNPGVDGFVSSLAVQADGRNLVGGAFSTLGGQSRSFLGRLNGDGSVDLTFNPGTDGFVYSLAVQADGRILVGGSFTTLGGQSRRSLGRLNGNGSVDLTFETDLGAGSYVSCLALQADGKILVGGSFTTLGGQSRSSLARLNEDGSVDLAFDSDLGEDLYDSPNVSSLVVQADGRILVGGFFTTLGGLSRRSLGRLNGDGSVDLTFNPGADSFVSSLEVQADGRILVGGFFTTLGGLSRRSLGRLNGDGSVDLTFNPGADGFEPFPGAGGFVSSLALQADGRILVGGTFSTLGGQSRSSLGRLNNTGVATESLHYDGGKITWLRGGSAPEIVFATFAQSTDGLTWTGLGEGERIADGWQLTGVSLSRLAKVRAQGWVSGSGWLVETVANVEDLWVEGPDLQIATLNSPLEAPAGSTQPVAWTLVNRGVLPATENWIDRVFLSTDAALGNDRLLGEFAVTGPLAVDETRPRQQAVPLPLDLAPDRDYWWIVVTDAADAVREQNEGNNVRISESPMRLLRPPAPNLVVAGVEPSANPRSGQPMTVTWSVRNAGTWSTGAGLWKDAVYLSADATLDDADRLLGRETRLRALGLDESYTNTLTTVLPPGTQGTWHLLVATDVENRVNEDDRENDNLSAPVPVAITLTPPPDLQVLALQIPAFASSGESIPVAWTGTNAGPGGTIQETWIDDVYLSPTPTLGAQSIRVASVPRTGALAAQASYAVSVPVTIPTGLTGTFHVLVFADAGQQVFEHESEGNNVAVAPTTIQITLTPPPDLAVAEVSAPASALASHALTLSYGVTNRAAVATPGASWEDRLYLVTDPANANLSPEGGSGVLYLGSLWRTGVLPAGQSYGNSFTVTLPDGLSGDWYAVVQTDAADAVFEVEHANNRRASAAPIRIESRPADLIVTAFGAPASAQSGAGLTASWTVRNQGSGDSAVTRWTDRVMLSLDGTTGNEDDVVLLTLEHEGLLAAGATYSIVNQLVSLPLSVPPGDRRLFVVTDAGGGVYEAAREDNNLSATRALTVTRSTADLRVAAVSVAPSPGDGDGPVTLDVRSEDVVTVHWTVENSGVVAPNAGAWADAVYLSASGALDDQAILLGTVGVGTPPAPGAAYSRAEEFVLPAELAGEFRVLVVTDATGEVIEENRANNLLAGLDTVRVTLRPVPDLEVVAISGPAEAYSGQPAEFTWTVRNNGPAAAPGEWFDRVYLSADATFDPDEDVFVGYAARPAGLAAGESYTQTVDLTLPREVSGLLQLVVVADGSDRVNERGAEANNVARAANTVAVWLRPPTDLEVGTITIPADGVAGYDLALTYTLHNRGANGAYGPWVDSLYFSTDDRWDVDDVLFAHVGQTGVLAAGESRTRTATAPAPGVLPGQYHVIVRSDVLVQVPDTDRSNNVRASLDRVASGVEELVLGQAAHRGLSTGQALYYRIGVPAGQWLVIEVDAAQAGAATELYVRGAAIPTRSEFDWTDAKPLQADHRLVIPETQAGEYYVLVYGNQVPAPGATDLTVRAYLSQFLVIDTDYGRGGNAGELTIQVNGADFDRTCTAAVRDAAGIERPAVAHYYESSTRFYPTLDLRGLEPGTYSVVVRNADGSTLIVPDSLRIVQGGGANLDIQLIAPPAVRRPRIPPSRTFPFTVVWQNTGLNDANAPVIQITSSENFRPEDEQDRLLESLPSFEFFAYSIGEGPPGITRPGQYFSRSFVTIDEPAEAGVDIFYSTTRKYANEQEILDWNVIADTYLGSIQPGGEDREWLAVLTQNVGIDNRDFMRMVSRNANALPLKSLAKDALGQMIEHEALKARAATTNSISGKVFSRSFATAISDRIVVALDSATGNRYESGTLKDGSFMMPDVTPGRYRLWVVGSGISNSHELELDVQDGVAVSGVVLELTQGARLNLEVSDQFGLEVPDVRVIAILNDDPNQRYVANTVGRVHTLVNLPTGSYAVAVSAPGWAAEWISGIAIGPGGEAELGVVLEEEAVIVGSIVDLPGPMQVFAVPTHPTGLRFSGLGGSDAFRISELPAGEYRIEIEVAGDRYVSREVFDLQGGELENVGVLPISEFDARRDNLEGMLIGPPGPRPCRYDCENAFPYDPRGFREILNELGKLPPAGADAECGVLRQIAEAIAQGMVADVERLERFRDEYVRSCQECRKSNRLESSIVLPLGADEACEEWRRKVEACVDGSALFYLREAQAVAQNLEASVRRLGDAARRYLKCIGNDEKKCIGDSCDKTDNVGSFDPNDIVGPGGYGPEFWISPDRTFHYTIRYENDAKKAEAPAQYVRVVQKLDPDLDPRTFRLGVMGFGSHRVEVPGERVFYETAVDVLDELGVMVEIRANLDLDRGEVIWEFTSIDPLIDDLPWDPFIGFLPPNKDGVEGQGFVTYTIRPKAEVASGDIVNAEARIFFDYNDPIDTPPIFNTLDVGGPTGRVLALPEAVVGAPFTVRWEGTDATGGAGVGAFDVYVSEDNEAWELWLAGTPDRSAPYPGKIGHTYAFRAVARDYVGHVEADPGAVEAFTRVDAPPGVVVGRHVFYNQSVFDGNDANAGVADDGAIATDKTALRPGQKATFANYTGYHRGLNGLMVDIRDLAGEPTAADFAFRMGNTADPSGWAAGPAPTSVTVRRGAGVEGSDRVTLIWGANAPKKQWLQVTVLATSVTGLGQPDVFYFGNAVGETGNSAGDARVTAADALRILGNVSASVGITNRFDINRDGKVGAADRLMVLGNLSAIDPVILLDLSGGAALNSVVRVAAGVRFTEMEPVEGGLRVGWVADAGTVLIRTSRSLAGEEWETYDTIPATGVVGDLREVILPIDAEDSERYYRLDTLREVPAADAP